MTWLVAVIPALLFSCAPLGRGEDSCAPEEATGAAMLQRASRSAGYMLQEDHMLNHSHGNGSNGTNNATQKAQRIIEAVDACLHPRHVEAAGHEDTLLRLEFVRMAEILTRLVAANISVFVIAGVTFCMFKEYLKSIRNRHLSFLILIPKPWARCVGAGRWLHR